jgi:hypothetical protein
VNQHHDLSGVEAERSRSAVGVVDLFDELQLSRK